MVEQNIGLGVTNYGVSKLRDACGGTRRFPSRSRLVHLIRDGRGEEW